jgi:hypothetical protein
MRRVFTLLRRAGTVANTGAWYGPGSAAHRYALRCVRGTHAFLFSATLRAVTARLPSRFMVNPG